MAIDGVIYGLIGWYIRNIWPGKFGMPQPLYFPLLPAYWCGGCTCCNANSDTDISNNHSPNSSILGEVDPDDLVVGVSTVGLNKVYSVGCGRQKFALRDVTLKVFENQVTVLLGHNGAGKSTLISLLTGLHPPSSGNAFVHGKSVRSDVNSVRDQIGVCPQHDVLYDFMTVQEHMIFYANLKSSQRTSQINLDIKRTLTLTGLFSSRHVKASLLSGGQRRRLHAALAFIGGSRVVILDEPTSGIDPSARRAIWELICNNRLDRTILLCTHHLDEADAIGDRVIIMHKGEVVCKGSPMYLKQSMGEGYQLTILKEQKYADRNHIGDFATDVLILVNTYVPGARILTDVGPELKLVLPTDQGQLERFADMFQALDRQMNTLGIDSYGITDSSLEEVYLKVSGAADDGNLSSIESVRDSLSSNGSGVYKPLSSDGKSSDARLLLMTTSKDRSPTQPSSLEDSSNDYALTSDLYSSRRRGFVLFCMQVWALFFKRLVHSFRDYRSYLSQFLLPAAFICLGMGVSLLYPPNKQLPSLLLTPDLYNDKAIFYRIDETSSPVFKEMAVSLISRPGLSTTCMNDSTLRGLCREDYHSAFPSTPTTYLPLSSTPECTCTDGHQACPPGSEGGQPPAMTTWTHLKLYNFSGMHLSTSEYYTRTYKLNMATRIGGLEMDATTFPNAKIWYDAKFYHALPGLQNALSNMILRSRVVNNSQAYGISTFSHPLKMTAKQLNRKSLIQALTDTGISITILCALCFIPAGYSVYMVNERIHKEKRMQLVTGVGKLTYWTMAWTWDMLNYMLSVGLISLITYLFNIDFFTARMNFKTFVILLIMFGWATIPMAHLLSRCFKDVSVAYLLIFLFLFFTGIATTVCIFIMGMFSSDPQVHGAHHYLNYLFLIFPSYCFGIGLVDMMENQFTTDIYAMFGQDTYVSPFSINKWRLLALGVQGLVLLLINLVIDMLPSCLYRERLSGVPSSSTQGGTTQLGIEYPEEAEVGYERGRVVNHECDGHPLVVTNLRKTFRRHGRPFPAVANLAFSVPTGQCFGLLGVNGAGKSTTFNMFTGEVTPTCGTVTLLGKKVVRHLRNVNQNFGYCPQQNALDGHLKVIETLHYFCWLKGFPNPTAIANDLMSRYGLTAHAHTLIKNCSGGTKRKVAVAVAMLGNPPVVLMDEPTTGMDPQSRRLVWDNVLAALQHDRSIVITSHTMRECETLCSRMTIMVNGKMMCLGSPQELKYKYGKSYTIVIRVLRSEANIKPVVDIITEHIPSTEVKDQHLKQVELSVPATSGVHLWQLFALLEQDNIRRNIENYVIMQASLDQVFHSFARLQNNDYGSDPMSFDNPGYTAEGRATVRSSMYSSIPTRHAQNTSRTLQSVPYEIETVPDQPPTKSNVNVSPQELEVKQADSVRPSDGRPTSVAIGESVSPVRPSSGDLSEDIVTENMDPQRQTMQIDIGDDSEPEERVYATVQRK